MATAGRCLEITRDMEPVRVMVAMPRASTRSAREQAVAAMPSCTGRGSSLTRRRRAGSERFTVSSVARMMRRMTFTASTG